MLQETLQIRNLIWLSKPLILRDWRKQGEGQPLLSVSICTHTVTGRRSDNRGSIIFYALNGTHRIVTPRCSQTIQRGLVTSVCNPPSTQHAPLPRSSGTTQWPTSEREKERGGIRGGDDCWGKIENIRCLVVWCLTEMELTWTPEADSSLHSAPFELSKFA